MSLNGAGALPAGPTVPRHVQTVRWIARPHAMMEDCRRRYGDVFTLRLLQEGDWVFLSHPDAIKQVFTGDPQRLHAGEANTILGPVLGRQSILLLDEEPHMRKRKLMLPSFHGERMQRYGDLMREVAEREVRSWPAGEPMAAWPRMQSVTLEVIMRAVFGVEEASRLERLRAAIVPLLDWTAQPKWLAVGALLGLDRMEQNHWTGLRSKREAVDELLYEEIRRRRDDPRLEERDDVLSLLLQARDVDGEPMSDEELRDQLMTLLAAGHDTTATSLSWALACLVRHPDVLERLRDELAAGKQEYLDAVIKETLRLKPVVVIVLRRLTEPMEIAGHELPAGTNVTPCIYLMHRREDVYPEPLRFRPERFLEQPAGTYTWIPFGGGVRRCLGATFALFEMQTVLPAILRHVDLQAPEMRPERFRRRAITFVPGRGAQVVVSRRGAARNGSTPAAGARGAPESAGAAA